MKRKIKHNLKELFYVSTNETITIIQPFNDGDFCFFFYRTVSWSFMVVQPTLEYLPTIVGVFYSK